MAKRKRPIDDGRSAPEPAKAKELIKKGTPPDVTSARAKPNRHGKVTADKWNQ
jgi:hypothetical protein